MNLISMENNTYAYIDENERPLICISFTGTKSTDENFQKYLEETRHCYQDKQQIGIVFDATKASIPALSHQKMQAHWLKENRQLMQDYCVGTAYVIPHAAIRAVLKLIFSFQEQPVPHQVFAELTAAKAWVNERLRNKTAP